MPQLALTTPQAPFVSYRYLITFSKKINIASAILVPTRQVLVPTYLDHIKTHFTDIIFEDLFFCWSLRRVRLFLNHPIDTRSLLLSTTVSYSSELIMRSGYSYISQSQVSNTTTSPLSCSSHYSCASNEIA